MKLIKLSAIFIMAISLLAGCANSSEKDDNNADTASESTLESISESLTESISETKAPETEEEFHAAMINRSVFSLGNNYRIKKQIEKLKNNENVTIAYIGGSITEGVGGTAETCYAKRSFDKICELFGNTNSTYINAGLSGTPSVLGNIRLERDVLSNDPGIVFIEFAVNDGQDSTHKESYESMIYTIMENNPETAVILVFNRIESGYTCQENMSQTGERYSLPMISVNDAITPELDEGRLTWDEYSNDSSHPNDYGHELISEMIENFFTLEDNASPDEEAEIPSIPLNGIGFKDMTLVTSENISEENNLNITDTGGFTETNATVSGGFTGAYANNGTGESMKLSVNANSFFIIYKRNNSDTMGKAEVYLDGKKFTTINANDADGWGDPYSCLVIKYQSKKDMNIEIKIPDDSLDKNFEIVGFAYSENG